MARTSASQAAKTADPRLPRLVRRLRAFYGSPVAPPVTDPYRLILWEQVAYLADDATHLAAWRSLEATVGTTPDAILEAPVAALRKVTRKGGAIAFADRAERLRAVALRVQSVWKGDLDRVLKLPFIDARRELTRYPKIGIPGAELILLLSGAFPVLALESNELRVLIRLGYGREFPQYARMYSTVQSAADTELPASVKTRQAAHLLLRRHGKTICLRSRPRCAECPLLSDCPTGRAVVS